MCQCCISRVNSVFRLLTACKITTHFLWCFASSGNLEARAALWPPPQKAGCVPGVLSQRYFSYLNSPVVTKTSLEREPEYN